MRAKWRVRGAMAIVIAVTIGTPFQAWPESGSLGAGSFFVAFMFLVVAFHGAGISFSMSDGNPEVLLYINGFNADSRSLFGSDSSSALTAARRVKKILWLWSTLGGAILVLSLSIQQPSSLDEEFGMIGAGWLFIGISALIMESVSYTHENILEGT